MTQEKDQHDIAYDDLHEQVGQALNGSNIIIALSVLGEFQTELLEELAQSSSPKAKEAVDAYVSVLSKDLISINTTGTTAPEQTLQ